MRINWIAAIFISIAHSSARLRQKLWRWVYNKIASKDISGKFVFMNYGYHDESWVKSAKEAALATQCGECDEGIFLIHR